MTSIIAMTVIIGITANYAYAGGAGNQIQDTVTDLDGEFYAWDISGASGVTTLQIRVVCDDGSFDSFLAVQTPSGLILENDDWDFGVGFICIFDSQIVYNPGQVENGCWVTQVRGFDEDTGDFILSLTMGPNGDDITLLGTVDSLDGCENEELCEAQQLACGVPLLEAPLNCEIQSQNDWMNDPNPDDIALQVFAIDSFCITDDWDGSCEAEYVDFCLVDAQEQFLTCIANTPCLPEPVMPIPTIDPPSVETILPRGESTGEIIKSLDPDDNEFFNAFQFGFAPEGDDCEESGFNDNIEKIVSFVQPFVSSEEFIANDDAEPGVYHCTLNIFITYEELFGDGGEIEKIVSQPVWVAVPASPPTLSCAASNPHPELELRPGESDEVFKTIDCELEFDFPGSLDDFEVEVDTVECEDGLNLEILEDFEYDLLTWHFLEEISTSDDISPGLNACWIEFVAEIEVNPDQLCLFDSVFFPVDDFEGENLCLILGGVLDDSQFKIEDRIEQHIWVTVPEPPLETEKFYTETDKDIEAGFFGTVLPFKNAVVDTENPTQVVKAVVDRNGNIKSYNPGQYYAVTKVTALQNLDEVLIFEKDQECTEVTGISQWNPAKIPGGAYVAMMCDGETEDITKELAKSGALFRNDLGVLEAHVDNVPEGCMVYLGVKYSPGLKGENVQSIDQPWCENWEIVNAVTESGEVFTDSAHMVLEVIGLPEPEPEPTTCEECSIASSDALILCDGELNCIISVQQEFAECTLTCEGDHNGIPEACFNSLSGGFSICLDFATTPDELDACQEEYVEQQTDCVANS